ncbi:type II toxin-antitoxin system VapC family toxin [Oryzibacter oryziterrae]|uniref:type II toxin-antitoxin system VapC family toxin n=1 Tax=Oryzibacter oryziterrae TaxID=2766474 RepID=UPI001F357DBC|nr:type II toxin-antitoxin system VapC family toxin [Oryzibacter oryziterrae]
MKETLVIDASVAIKWLITEDGSEDAVRLRSAFAFVAPEPILAECTNILWKKVQRQELELDEAKLASALLARAGIGLCSLQGLSTTTLDLAVNLGHPAYDCVYLALATRERCRFVTADRRLLSAVSQRAPIELAELCLSLEDAGRLVP